MTTHCQSRFDQLDKDIVAIQKKLGIHSLSGVDEDEENEEDEEENEAEENDDDIYLGI